MPKAKFQKISDTTYKYFCPCGHYIAEIYAEDGEVVCDTVKVASEPDDTPDATPPKTTGLPLLFGGSKKGAK